ncbi:MAG: hypothetical protein JJU27_05325 [Gammaproteobacteria bacterium]|nr:hypothetical protein [Gammaproteobacteria bacterium]
MSLRALPLLVFLLPAIGANLSMWLSQSLGLIPQCNVYLEGCASISAAGRYEPVIFFFRATMIATAVLMMLFWRLSCCWLAELGERSRTRLVVIEVIGYVAGIFLILYSTFLGTEGDAYRLMRRYGVTVFFAFSYLAQLLITGVLWHRLRAGLAPPSAWVLRLMVALCALMLLGGLASIPAAEWALDRSAANNIIEWNLSGLLMAWFLLVWLAWRQTAFHVVFRVQANT